MESLVYTGDNALHCSVYFLKCQNCFSLALPVIYENIKELVKVMTFYQHVHENFTGGCG